MPKKKKIERVKSRANGFRVRRLEALIAALQNADRALTACRAEQAQCIKRYGSALKRAGSERARYMRQHQDDLSEPPDLDGLSALELSKELADLTSQRRETLAENVAETRDLIKYYRKQGSRKRIRRYL